MAIVIQFNEPLKIQAGETVKWKRTFEDYPAPTWILDYRLVKTGKQEKITAVADGTDHSVVLTKTITAAYEPGIYHWQAWVDDGTERYQVDTGTLEVLTDFDQQSSGFDNRSVAQKMFEGIEAHLTGKITRNDLDIISYGISAAVSRNITKMTLAELRVERDFYLQEFKSEQAVELIANDLRSGRTIRTRFTR